MEDKNKKDTYYDPAESAFRVRQMILERKAREKAEQEEKLREYRRSQGLLENPEPKKQHFDSVNTLENDEATVLYIIVMLVGTIFHDRILIWIAATIIYFAFITRHDRK